MHPNRTALSLTAMLLLAGIVGAVAPVSAAYSQQSHVEHETSTEHANATLGLTVEATEDELRITAAYAGEGDGELTVETPAGTAAGAGSAHVAGQETVVVPVPDEPGTVVVRLEGADGWMEIRIVFVERSVTCGEQHETFLTPESVTSAWAYETPDGTHEGEQTVQLPAHDVDCGDLPDAESPRSAAFAALNETLASMPGVDGDDYDGDGNGDGAAENVSADEVHEDAHDAATDGKDTVDEAYGDGRETGWGVYETARATAFDAYEFVRATVWGGYDDGRAAADEIRQEGEGAADHARDDAENERSALESFLATLRGDAESDADRLRDDAESDADRLRDDVQGDADRLRGDAEGDADRLRDDAGDARGDAESDADDARGDATTLVEGLTDDPAVDCSAHADGDAHAGTDGSASAGAEAGASC